jgi:predicted neutral ceramidase superfamily lipid hydrolase
MTTLSTAVLCFPCRAASLCKVVVASVTQCITTTNLVSLVQAVAALPQPFALAIELELALPAFLRIVTTICDVFFVVFELHAGSIFMVALAVLLALLPASFVLTLLFTTSFVLTLLFAASFVLTLLLLYSPCKANADNKKACL